MKKGQRRAPEYLKAVIDAHSFEGTRSSLVVRAAPGLLPLTGELLSTSFAFLSWAFWRSRQALFFLDFGVEHLLSLTVSASWA